MAHVKRALRDAVVVVTGAASGIGRATAEAFCEAGAWVHGVDVDAPRLRGVAEALPAAKTGRFIVHEVDCRDAKAVMDLSDAVYAAHGRVDVLHNNAGVVVCGRAETLDLAAWRRAIDINFLGVVHGLVAFLPRMTAQPGGGHIVNTASISGLVGFPICAPYSATKFAVVGLTAVLDAELAPRGVRVSALCPGMVRTRVMETGQVDLPGPGRQWLARAMERHGLAPEQVARAVLAEVRWGRGGVRPLGLGSRQLWWLQRLWPTGMGVLFAGLSRATLRDGGEAQGDER